MSKPEKLYKNLRKCAKSGDNMRKCAKSWESAPKPEKVWESVLNATANANLQYIC